MAEEQSILTDASNEQTLLAGLSEHLVLYKIVSDPMGKEEDLHPIDNTPASDIVLAKVRKRIADTVKQELLAFASTERSDLVKRVSEMQGSVKIERFLPNLGKWYEVHLFSPMAGQLACLLIDIEARRLAEEKIRQSNEELKDLIKERSQELISALEREKGMNDLKSNFIAIASHQFRTPLTTILSSVRLVESYVGSGELGNCGRHLTRIKNSVSSLAEILDDILSVEKLEHGKVLPKMELFNLPAYIQNLVDEMAGLCKANQRIVYLHQGSADVLSDRSMLRNILRNLLSNAIKYSESIIHLSSTVEERSAIFTVSDKGIGIPEKDQQMLFGRFFRASNIGAIQGTGLGLHIVKHYVELLNGDISFTAEEQEGTTFCVRIPQVF